MEMETHLRKFCLLGINFHGSDLLVDEMRKINCCENSIYRKSAKINFP